LCNRLSLFIEVIGLRKDGLIHRHVLNPLKCIRYVGEPAPNP
jgi:hypothetical protein